MSLSQKYPGLILVPWFNSEEWQYVYHSIYAKEREQQLEAIQFLRLWKQRTPILSAGVEGTLIVLEALLLDTDSLSDDQISNLYAIALMRFLNLSAANSEKQGSFGRISTKNELPKWLINLRHDIAHGHQIPSMHNLKIGLDFGIQWLKQRYWEPQSKRIKDYVIEDNNTDVPDFEMLEMLKIYIQLILSRYDKGEINADGLRRIESFVYKKLRKNAIDLETHEGVLEIIRQILEKKPKLDQLSINELVSTTALLRINCETDELKQSFRDIWQDLLQVYQRYGLTFSVIEKLASIIGDISYEPQFKKAAALWINEIYLGLQKLQDSVENSSLDLVSNTYMYKEESKKLENEILPFASDYYLYFLQSLLKYNHCEDGNLSDLVQAKICQYDLSKADISIRTLEDLSIELPITEPEFTTVDERTNSSILKPTNHWTKIKDTSVFQNCPLGVLPQHHFQKHPFIK